MATRPQGLDDKMEMQPPEAEQFLPPRASVLQAGAEEITGFRIPRAWEGERRLCSEMRRSDRS